MAVSDGHRVFEPRGRPAAELLASALRGHPCRWPADGRPELDATVLDAAGWHGISPLLTHCLRRSGPPPGWPASVLAGLTDDARAQAVQEPLVRAELRRVLDALWDSGVRPVVVKGAHLAYSHYSNPCLRPRGDTDLFIEKADREPTRSVLEQLGYRPSAFVSGELVSHQFRYERADSLGLLHAYDVHWKLANQQVFADLLPFDEVADAALPIGRLGIRATGPTSGHALLLACIHRVAHHRNATHLIWLYDMRVLVRSMDDAELEGVAQLARHKQVTAVVADGLDLARARVGARVPSGLLEELRRGSGVAERSAVFLEGGQRKINELFSDLSCLSSWSDRLRLLREHGFPPASYMRDTYGVTGSGALPVLYAYRIVRGCAGWFRRSDP